SASWRSPHGRACSASRSPRRLRSSRRSSARGRAARARSSRRDTTRGAAARRSRGRRRRRDSWAGAYRTRGSTPGAARRRRRTSGSSRAAPARSWRLGRQRGRLGGRPAALRAELRPPEDRRTAFAALRRPVAAAGHGGGEQGVELREALLELPELDAAVDEQVLPELVPAVHLEQEAAEVAEALLADGEQAPALTAELGGRRQGPPHGTRRRRRQGSRSGRGRAAEAHRGRCYLRLRLLAPRGAAAEAREIQDREHEADHTDRDPHPRNDEEQDDPDHDQRDTDSDHESGLPAWLTLNHDETLFRHLADRPGWALLRVAGGLDPAVGHLVAAEGRRLVHDDAAELEPLGHVEGRVEGAREDARLEAEAGAVRPLDRLVERVDRVDDDDRAEDLVAADPRVVGDVREHRRLEQPVLLAARADLSARVVDPLADARARVLVDHRA